ncbi:restriction endonuclease subunit S [Mumia zhuanghuii]|uniref:Restriction endonuclease subunit S n=1 Tax=Mumia zhuanghuii TaxID=2585211 RepID=A0A5C4N406_9ACTN|nr:restriction endonuclease subunit S [Mumia zhuanghuii]TNC52579.1 restriction endonuclease subunit S [Mumia zhuanghuii]TNC52687.1 restriction endonuclease subunit S [Mumia zhuanghuii]
MSRIDDLIAAHCPHGVTVRTLGDVGKLLRGNGLQKKDLRDEGVGAIHYGQIFTTYGTTTTTTKSFVEPVLAARLRRAQPGDLVIATTSENDEDVCKAVAWLGDEEIAVSGDAFIYAHDLDPQYVSYFFQTEAFRAQKRRFISGTKVKRVSGADLARIKIPVPPLAIQREIASILDKMESLKAELEAELELRSRQHSYFRDVLLTFGNDIAWSTLGGISAKVSSGGTPPTGRADYYGGGIPWLRTQEVDYGVVTSTGKSITELGLANSSAKWVPTNTVVVAMYGATAAKVAITGIPLTTNQACCNLEIDPNQADYRYVFHWISHEYERLKALGEGSQSNLNAQKVKSYPIPVPPLEEQRRIAALLDRFDALVNDLSIGLPAEIEARRKQYEYYRDKLLTFEEAA